MRDRERQRETERDRGKNIESKRDREKLIETARDRERDRERQNLCPYDVPLGKYQPSSSG